MTSMLGRDRCWNAPPTEFARSPRHSGRASMISTCRSQVVVPGIAGCPWLLPAPTPPVAAIPFPQLVIDSAYGRSANASEFIRTSAAIKVQDESWSWRDEEGTVLADGLAKIDAYARAEVGGGMALPDADIVDLGVL